MTDRWDVVVVGAGAAGLIAAAESAGRGKRTLLLEKNRRAGVKILMSGGTRCNITQATDNRGIVAAFGPAGRFLHAPLAALSVEATIAMFERLGVPTKTESTGKVFPQSNKATDVLAALERQLASTSCTVALEEAVQDIERQDDAFQVQTSRRELVAEKIIVTTGGQSYPGSGTTGDGYSWMRRLGHTLVEPRPALVPVTTPDAWVKALTGITIEDVGLRVVDRNEKDKTLAERRGSFLFTHFGLSGPVVLDVSRQITLHPDPQSLVLECDFLPQLNEEALVQQLRQEATEPGRRQLASILPERVPKRLADALLEQAGLNPAMKFAELASKRFVDVAGGLKRVQIAVQGTRGFAKAEVTAGGVALDEVDSKTMQSKIVPGMHLAGEILDLDGPIGGYNFQAAWSTGFLAGRSV